ncbi:hypothetical protein [uncultured Nevskia sp.]|uniref:hypothetical protein n=1 Tax=uncultured Nevskia sp. TaxID=228950 RepID=UPI0025FBCDBF|nr:hypothetical protein [uncultured Nevskia sp.]
MHADLYAFFIFSAPATSRNPTATRRPMHGPELAGVGAISMTMFLLLLGVAGFAILISYVLFCDRI